MTGIENPEEFELPVVQPVMPDMGKKEPSLPPEMIQGILDEIEKGEDPFAPEEKPMHDTDRPGIPDIDEVIRRNWRN
jgi:hypothetical protein